MSALPPPATVYHPTFVLSAKETVSSGGPHYGQIVILPREVAEHLLPKQMLASSSLISRSNPNIQW